MRFQDELRKSLKTREQLREEAAEAETRRNHSLAKSLYAELKEEILRKARCSEAVCGKLTGTFDMGTQYDPFIKSTVLTADSKSYEVEDMKMLDAVCADLCELAAADSIVLGEPFLHVTDGDEHLRRMDQRVRRRFGKLSCKIENTANRHIYAHVAVDYECRV